MITVFTPTYNRGHLLQRLYYSLCSQTYKDFEWIIVDDGSVDNTEDVVKTFLSENLINIRYIKQDNGGKHRAINHGVREAKGELFLILDSDDSIPDNSLALINEYYSPIKTDHCFGGVAGYMAHHDGKLIGISSEVDILDATSIEMRSKYNMVWDMCEVFRTDMLKEFPFPEIEDEKFCPEDLILNRISTKYKFRVFNRVIYYRDYLDGGLTDKIVRIRMNSPIASMMCYAEQIRHDIPVILKIKSAINYWRFRFCYKGKDNRPFISKIWMWTVPLGFLMHLNDLRK